jgi:hypothetical protein
MTFFRSFVQGNHDELSRYVGESKTHQSWTRGEKEGNENTKKGVSDNTATAYEKTKKGAHAGKRTPSVWLSPRFGPCRVRPVIAAADGWVLVQGLEVAGLLAWVREEHVMT